MVTQTFLESKGVTLPTYNDYRARVVDFIQWCLAERMNWSSDEELDAVLIIWMDCMFWRGLPPNAGGKLFAGIK
eukprot:12410445-Karenia_brevis.AAC.1